MNPRNPPLENLRLIYEFFLEIKLKENCKDKWKIVPQEVETNGAKWGYTGMKEIRLRRVGLSVGEQIRGDVSRDDGCMDLFQRE